MIRSDFDPRENALRTRLDTKFEELPFARRRFHSKNDPAKVSLEAGMRQNPAAVIAEFDPRGAPRRKLARRPPPILPVFFKPSVVNHLRDVVRLRARDGGGRGGLPLWLLGRMRAAGGERGGRKNHDPIHACGHAPPRRIRIRIRIRVHDPLPPARIAASSAWSPRSSAVGASRRAVAFAFATERERGRMVGTGAETSVSGGTERVTTQLAMIFDRAPMVTGPTMTAPGPI